MKTRAVPIAALPGMLLPSMMLPCVLMLGLASASAQSGFAPPVPAPKQQGFVPVAAPPAPKTTPAQNAAPRATRQAAADRPSGPANALQGFSRNRDKPVKIDAGALEVRDKDRMATFSGNVRVVQGDTTMRSATLTVHYEDDPARSSMALASPGPNGQQRIRLLEAKGGVRVSQADQIATGDSGLFNMRENTVTLTGNVVISRGQDVLRGQRLVVDLTNGVSRMEAGPGGTGRVEGMFRAGGGNPIIPDPGLNQPKR